MMKYNIGICNAERISPIITAIDTAKQRVIIIKRFFIIPWLTSSTCSVNTHIAGSASTTHAPKIPPIIINKGS